MGARNSKRSMDVTTTPKKEGVAEGGEAPVVGDGKLERIEEADAKPTTNGVAPHTDAPEDKDNEKEKDLSEKETNKTENETKTTEESSSPAEEPAADAPPAEEEQVTTPTEETNTSIISASSPDSKETMKKEKSKKKWSWRSISFSKKDKNKPVREETPKNGDVSKDESLAEGGEEAENAAASPAEEKSVTSLNESTPAENEVKNEEKPAAPEVTSSPAEEKQEAPSSPTAPIPVPVEDKKEEKTEKEVEKVEVSPTQAVAAPIEVMSQPQPIIAPSIIERKTSEDFPSLLPSSPPPTPINPSPLQQAQSAAANASALAEALKLPAEADLANACHLNYHRNDNEILNNESESLECNVEIDSKAIESKKEVEEVAQVESKAIETQDVQSIVEDVHRENVDTDISIEEQSSLLDLSDSLKSCPIEVKEITVETTAAIVDQQTCSEKLEKIDGDSKTEKTLINKELIEDYAKENLWEVKNDDHNTEKTLISKELIEDYIMEKNDDHNTDVKMEVNTTLKTDTEDEEIPPPIPESPIPVPKTSSQFINFITSQIEDSHPLPEPVKSDNVMQQQLNIEDLSLQSTDNSIPSPPTEAALDTSIESQNPLSLQEINNLPSPPPEIAACEQVPDIVSSNPQETVEDIPTLPRSPSPEVSHGIIESSNELVEPEINNDKIEAFVEQNNHEFIEETIAVPVEEINTKSDLENRQSDTIEEKTASTDSLLNHQIQKNDQSIPETEAPVENPTLNSTTESTEETPKSPLASVQTEVTAPVAPAITEDVTSVTKAVEEIGINEKAVAAAVNENIESANKNEIIADMNYQNLNE